MHYDVIVVGGSFAGQSAALQLARARRHVLVVDAGLPRNRFADASHGFLTQDGRPPQAIIREAACQLGRYSTAEVVSAEISTIQGSIDAFSATLSDGRSVSARRIILATGVTDRLPKIVGLKSRWGATVLHCPYCHGYEARDQRLGVLATQPSAVLQAMLMPDWGSTILFTQGHLDLSADERAALASRGVTIESRAVVELIRAEAALEEVRLEDGELRRLEALFVARAIEMASPRAYQLGCAFDDGPLGPVIRTDAMKATTVSGIWAAGDAARGQHNATLAAADGVLAGIAAHQSLALAAVPV